MAEPDAQPVGRPLKFKNASELDMAIQLYFDKQDPHVEKRQIATGTGPSGKTMFEERDIITDQKPYTLSGLARALGVDRGTILNYSKKAEFFSTIEAARTRCHEYAEEQLFIGNANGAKFALTNNYSTSDAVWADKQVLAGDKDAPLMPIGLDAAILKRKANGKTSSSTTADSSESS